MATVEAVESKDPVVEPVPSVVKEIPPIVEPISPVAKPINERDVTDPSDVSESPVSPTPTRESLGLESVTDEEFDSQFDTGLVKLTDSEVQDITDALSITELGVGQFFGSNVDDPIEIKRAAIGAGASYILGNVGSKVPPLPGPAGLVVNPWTMGFAGSTAGLILGNYAPELMIEVLEKFNAMPEGTRDEMLLSPRDLATVVKGEVVLDTWLFGGLSAVRLVGRPMGRLIAGVSEEGLRIAREAAKRGIHLIPVQVGNRKIARGFVVVAGRLPFIASSIRLKVARSGEAIAKIWKDMPARLGPLAAFAEISDDIFLASTNLFKHIDETFSRQYTELYETARLHKVQIIPRASLKWAKQALKDINNMKVKQIEHPEEESAGEAFDALETFIKNKILSMGGKTTKVVKGDEFSLPRKTTDKTVPGPVRVAEQSLDAMDTLSRKVDEELLKLPPDQQNHIRKMMVELKQAIQEDVLTNMRGPHAGEITRRYKEIDKNYSYTFSTLFETATAKKFMSVIKGGGLKSKILDNTTRQHIDQLAKIVINLESPQAIKELFRLMPPEMEKRIVAKIFADAISDSMKHIDEFTTEFSPSTIAKRLGLDSPVSNRRLAIKTMLEETGSKITMTELDELFKHANKIAGLEIMDVSTFIMRATMFGSIRGTMNAMIPGLTLAGASGGLIARTGSTLIGMMGFLLGGKGISAMLANEATLQPLKLVLDKETSQVIRRKAWLQVGRLTLNMFKVGGEAGANFSEEKMERLSTLWEEGAVELDDFVEKEKGKDKHLILKEEK